MFLSCYLIVDYLFMKQAKLGHRKSHSFAGIQVEMKQEAPVCSDNADAIENWVHSGMKSRSIGPEFHFFSDTEVEVRSPTQSRPSTPIHSDTEYEVLDFTLVLSHSSMPSTCPILLSSITTGGAKRTSQVIRHSQPA